MSRNSSPDRHNDDPNNTRILDTNDQQPDGTANPTDEDEESITDASASVDDVQEWKCRECGFVNKGTKTKCDTCERKKPRHPIYETRLSHTKRSPSTSSSSRAENDQESQSSNSSDDDVDHSPKSEKQEKLDYTTQSYSTISNLSSPSKENNPKSVYKSIVSQVGDDTKRLDSNKNQTKDRQTSSSPSKTSDQAQTFVVYVPDLPVNIENSQTLENMIRECLERGYKQKILDIQCFTQLGIGRVRLHSEKDRKHLLDNIEKILIEKSSNTTVSFVRELELISYVVIETKDTKNIPSVDEMCQRWIQLYKPSSKPDCRLLSIQFPSIFQITTSSLDELLQALSIKDFSISNQFASVYFRADHCFFEDLPRKTTLDQLKQAINQKISDKYMSRELIHIQYNKDACNAIIITSGRARIWSLHNSIELDGRHFMKKNILAYRLLIEKAPKDLPISAVCDHKIFRKNVVKVIPSHENIILEVSDRSVYEDCIDRGALRIDDRSPLGIKSYTWSDNPEDDDIDAGTWYETDMTNLKSDIMPFMSDSQHRIFRMRWNPNAFLAQFQRCSTTDKKLQGKDLEKENNNQRHLLRMTVMLNTIGIVKKGYYRIGDKEIKLKPERLKTIRYDHKSRLQRDKTLPFSEATQTSNPSTTVRVVKEDCLIVYNKLVAQGYRPVILNMANATSPGGGYKRGDGAQEETLFRRSNYYQSLDMTLDEKKPSARFYCSSSYDLEPFDDGDKLYPMEKFGAIYTSGLTVFRSTEETGYDFMDIPMYDVCAIAMAAYRDPKLENKNFLNAKYSINTRKKIENIFAIAYQHKHDCLVLSALGCGAFRNPPSHIASIFKSVIEQYAGFFKCIYFSVLDDHNAYQDLNPNGNYEPFRSVLDNLNVEPQRYKAVRMMIGPRRILKQTTNKEFELSDIRICYLPPCHHGAKCENINDDRHCKEYLHPPLCPYATNQTTCKDKQDPQHTLWFRHREKCKHGGECKSIENDPAHSNEFEHPVFCRDGGKCDNMDREHLKEYRHLPLCRHRRQCTDYNRGSVEHCQSFRHCIPMCRFGAYCVRFHDEKHFNEEKHPFQKPCPFTPFHCQYFIALSESKDIKSLSVDVQNHCSEYSHVCRFGRDCREKGEIHWRNTIHVARHYCQNGDKCKMVRLDEHLNSFTHPGIADIRRLCLYTGYKCRDRYKSEHIVQYRHNGDLDRTGVIACFGLNKKANFMANQEHMFKAIADYAKNLTSTNSLSISPEILQLVKGLQPVHRCGKVIFESILVHGHVMSREHMKHLEKPSFVAQAVHEHKRVRAILDQHKTMRLDDDCKEYIQAIVSREYNNKYSGLAAGGDFLSMTTADTSSDLDRKIRVQERILGNTLKQTELDTIKQYAKDIAEASWNLNHTPLGLGYPPDEQLGTNKHVFSILGPNLGHYYGDIIIVFKREVMLHPDANFSPQAATSFFSGRTFSQRPWVKKPGTNEHRVKCFHRSKLHCSVPRYEYAAAAELMAITGAHKKTMDVCVKDIFARWKKVDAHEVFEAHLPQLVPLDYIDEIYMPKNLFASLNPAAQESAKRIFRDSLHITDHKIDLTAIGGGGSRPADASRADYQDYVVDKLIEKFKKSADHPNDLHGILVTLEPTKFRNHIVLPITIDGTFNQYRHTHKHAPTPTATYIYWQAKYGDMMVTLSDEQIDPYSKQPNIQCLVCYVAELPSTTRTTNYHELYSYLNAGDPYGHDAIMNSGNCSAYSRSFHRGCNIENFLTYCLKIERKTGEVILSHAGPNGIYCYETISYQFPHSALDLNKLNFIHVSAGSQKVPMQNLIVSCEQISDLHPSFDKEFKGVNTNETQNKKPHVQDRKPPSNDKEPSDDKSPSLGRKFINAVGNLFGYESDDKNLEPCPYSVNCLLQNSSDHMKQNSHPCPYSELCTKKDKEPHLTHEPHRVEECSSKGSCDKLNDPFHRAKYRHPGYPDFLTPCSNGPKCSDKSIKHRKEYSHGEQVQISRNNKSSGSSHRSSSPPKAAEASSNYHENASYDRKKDAQRISCRYGSDCRDKNDPNHCSQYSHPNEPKAKSSSSSHDDRTPCRYGSDCRDKNDPNHCALYSHPDERGLKSPVSSNHRRMPCRHGSKCWDKKDRQHCSQYSHPDD